MWENHLRTHLHRRTETITADRDGNVTITHSTDAEKVFEGVKLMSDAQVQTPTRDRQGRLYLGSVDPITATNWAKECGHPLYSKEWKEYAKKKLMSNEFSKFRAEGVRKLI